MDLNRIFALERKALHELRYQAGIIRGVGSTAPIVCVVRNEALGDAHSLLLCRSREPYNGMRDFLIRTMWERTVDLERSRDPKFTPSEPTMTTQWKPVDSEWSAAMEARLASMSLPVRASHALQVDGTHHEMLLQNFHIEWGNAAPLEWEAAAEILKEMFGHWEVESEYNPDDAFTRPE